MQQISSSVWAPILNLFKRSVNGWSKVQSTSNSAQSTDQKPCVIIAGDSMLKFINGRKLSSQISNQGLTYVEAFPGATAEDMSDYIMPSLRRKPEEVILHVGTNNLKSFEPRDIAEGIINLGLKIQNHSPDCKICLLYTSPSPRDGLLSRMPSSA